MIGDCEIRDGYRIKALINESADDVRKDLEAGKYDGVSFNPYGSDFRSSAPGWTGDINLFLEAGLPLKAISIPFADRVGLNLKILDRIPDLEMLLLADFSGCARISLPSLRVLSIGLTDKLSLGNMPNLKIGYIANASSEHIENLAQVAPLLEELSLVDSSITDISGLAGLSQLASLELAHLPKLRDISCLQNLPSLKVLRLEAVRRICGLEAALAALTSLRELYLCQTPAISSWQWLSCLHLEVLRCVSVQVPGDDHAVLRSIPDLHIPRRKG